MRPLALATLLAALALCASSDEPSPEVLAEFFGKLRQHPSVAQELGDDREILERADTFELLYLDPERFDGDDEGESRTFHQRKVVHAISIPGRRTQLGIVRELYRAFDTTAASEDWQPSHGIRARLGTRAIDLVISLPSNGTQIFRAGGKASRVLNTSAAPRAMFDALRALADKKTKGLDPDTRDVLDTAETLELFVTDPRRSGDVAGAAVKTSRTLTWRSLRWAMLEALYSDLGDALPAPKAGKPAYALRATSLGATVTVGVSFDAKQLVVHGGAKPRAVALAKDGTAKAAFAGFLDRVGTDQVKAALGELWNPVAARLDPEATELLARPDYVSVQRYSENDDGDAVRRTNEWIQDDPARLALLNLLYRAIGPEPASDGERPERVEGPFYLLRFQRDARELRVYLTAGGAGFWNLQAPDGNTKAAFLALAAPDGLRGWLEGKLGKLDAK